MKTALITGASSGIGAEFARDYKVVALDLRGYNESDRFVRQCIALAA